MPFSLPLDPADGDQCPVHPDAPWAGRAVSERDTQPFGVTPEQQPPSPTAPVTAGTGPTSSPAGAPQFGAKQAL